MAQENLETRLSSQDDGIRRTYIERKERKFEEYLQEKSASRILEKRKSMEEMAYSKIKKAAIDIFKTIYTVDGLVASTPYLPEYYREPITLVFVGEKPGKELDWNKDSLLMRLLLAPSYLIFAKTKPVWDAASSIRKDKFNSPEHEDGYKLSVDVVEPIVKRFLGIKTRKYGNLLCNVNMYFDSNGEIVNDPVPNIVIYGEDSVPAVLELEKKLVDALNYLPVKDGKFDKEVYSPEQKIVKQWH